VPIGLFGLGSVLMGDDAVGPFFISLFTARYELPEEVTILDAGTPGMDLVHYIRGHESLIVVDTVKAEGPPGRVHFYRKDEILEGAEGLRLSPHDPTLRQALLTADFSGDGPEEVLLIGVVPDEVTLRTRMSDEVKAAMPEVEQAVLKELRRLGVQATRKDDADAPDIWWEVYPS
jgi:hydrogenase maturation protease